MLRADEIASIQNAILPLLPDIAIITRTNASYPCRLSDDNQRIHIEGMPRIISLPRWKLKFPASADIQPWDEATIAGKGTYLLTEPVSNQTFNFANVSYAVASQPSIYGVTLRDPDPQADTITVTQRSQHLQKVTLRSLGDYLLTSVSPQWEMDNFGSATGGIYRAYANWPQAADYLNATQASENFPFQPEDTLVLADTRVFTIRRVENFAPRFAILYLQLVPDGWHALSDDNTSLVGLVIPSGGNVTLLPPS